MADRRRRLLVLGGALAGLRLARAAPPARLGLLLAGPRDSPESRLFLHEFREGMREHGRDGAYVISVRSYAHEEPRIARAVEQLVAVRCDVLLSETSAGAAALQRRARGTPVVVAAALERPEGELTGLMAVDSRISAQLVALARELLPRGSRLGFLCDAGRAAEAPPELERLELAGAADLPRFAERLAASQADALVVAAHPRLFALREPIVREALEAGVPTLAPAAAFADLGALASHGCDVADNFRAAAGFVDRLLKGARPGELPVAPPSRYELVLNLRTARALHLELPNDALLRADRVIE